MVESVSLESAKFGQKFIINEFISFVLVLVTENERVTKMHSMGLKIRKRKDRFDLVFDISRNVFAEKNRRFIEIW